jgi:broad-specificity NMP kinase
MHRRLIMSWFKLTMATLIIGSCGVGKSTLAKSTYFSNHAIVDTDTWAYKPGLVRTTNEEFEACVNEVASRCDRAST